MAFTRNDVTTPTSTTGPPPGLRAFYGASFAYIGYTVVISLIGLLATFPDKSHVASAHVTLGQVVFGYGTIMSPPLYFMAVIGLLLWGASAQSARLSRSSVALTVIGVLYSALVGISVLAGGHPDTYSIGKWAVALVLGVGFLVASAAVVAAGLRSLLQGRAARAIQ